MDIHYLDRSDLQDTISYVSVLGSLLVHTTLNCCTFYYTLLHHLAGWTSMATYHLASRHSISSSLTVYVVLEGRDQYSKQRFISYHIMKTNCVFARWYRCALRGTARARRRRRDIASLSHISALPIAVHQAGAPLAHPWQGEVHPTCAITDVSNAALWRRHKRCACHVVGALKIARAVPQTCLCNVDAGTAPLAAGRMDALVAYRQYRPNSLAAGPVRVVDNRR